MQETFENHFGAVNGGIVSFFDGRGWFMPGTRVDVPIKHVIAVGVEPRKHIVWGVVLFVVALSMFPQVEKDPVILFAIAFYAWLGFFLMRGWPVVIVRTADGRVGTVKGRPSQWNSAEEYSRAVREKLSELNIDSGDRTVVRLEK